ncbi:flavin reductase family protein [Lacticaseibacillus mingshuiensis]|uniref:Flavin reductase family protein n=1 Tax=Lacticaseibacillus mingshuiensis TaxID=2799574 RepID=A0ABW4CGK8_9LACO|nr:flavin reductase family protein [Lacticaseibacillus mingshuiensis]
MITRLSKDLDARTQYKLLAASIIPRAIAWITTLDENGHVNLAPFSFFSGVSNQKPLLSIAIIRAHGQPKDTAANLLATGEGVIHLVTTETAAQMNMTAASLPAGESEVATAGLHLTASTAVAAPSLQEALVRLEVKLYQHVPIEIAGAIATDLFILEVVAFQFDPSVFDPATAHLDVAALAPLARLAGPQYATLGPLFSMTRPDHSSLS